MMGTEMRKAFLVEQFEAELPTSLEVLRAVPADALDWKPHRDSYSLGRLAMHVASIPGWMPTFVNGTGYDMGAGGSGPAVPASRDEILARFDSASGKGRQVLRDLDEATLGDAWSLLRDGEVVSTMTRGEAIARYVIRHTVHHRGQLAVYLRLRGVPVPPLYGDSADLRLLPRSATP
jgi:uncharacterized damage-inducible protein DinB